MVGETANAGAEGSGTGWLSPSDAFMLSAVLFTLACSAVRTTLSSLAVPR